MMIDQQSTGSASPTSLAHNNSGEEMSMEIIEKLNGVQIVKNDEGKFGIDDLLSPSPVKFRYRTLVMARQIAASISAENDHLDESERTNS